MAIPFPVPIVADPVLSPQIRIGRLDVEPPGVTTTALDAIVFPLGDESLGRVTFEGLDAIRRARGEYLPYERRGSTFARDEWVYLVEDSGWLAERHGYEQGHYDTPLIDSHDHYLFVFHDEFIEAIARGIWLDQPALGDPFAPPETHPLLPLSDPGSRGPSESFGISWELVVNPVPVDDLLVSSLLCSQRLMQYDIVLDGHRREHASVWIRTRRGETVSSFVTGFFGNTPVDVAGVASELTFSTLWLECVESVATRRREMGLQ